MPLQLWLQIVPFTALIILGFTVGGYVERRHFKRLTVAEVALSDVIVTDLSVPSRGTAIQLCGFVTGEVVIASDYFKTIAAKIKSLFGGELRTFETLIERARREALVRMITRAKGIGANRVYNVRFESSNIGAVRRNKATAMVELYAYGTAVYVSE